jgi:hypothetical protein
MTRRGLRPRSGGIFAVGLTTAVAAVAGLAPHTASPAAAAPEECVAVFPADELTPGLAVNGLTVTSGTVPEAFSGRYVDTLVDGIAPGVDLIVADLTSEAIDKNGIWQGMSGSPVYDPTGKLIGAVSYALSMGHTTIAGITPAAEMLGMLEAPLPAQVSVPRSMRTALVRTGDATRAQASAGLRRLPVPMAVSGLTQRRFDQLDGWLGEDGAVTRATSSTSAAAERIDIVPGGNLAASLSFGTITAAAIGTATAVCGDQVVGFGHPLAYAGDTTYSLHGASAVTILPDLLMSAYKLANLGAPVGTVTEDRLAGLHGVLGPLPKMSQVSSTATYRGRSEQGTSHVSVPEQLSDIGLATMAAINDRAVDHEGEGSAVATWTIRGQRRNGTPFTLTSGDRYADRYDIAGAPVMDLARQLYALTENETERVTITSVTTSTAFQGDATSWRLGRAYWKAGGDWHRVTHRQPVVVKAGASRAVRVELVSRDRNTRFVHLRVAAPARTAGQVGNLLLAGGSGGEDDFYFFEDEEAMVVAMFGGGEATTIPALIKAFRTEQKNDEIRSTLRFRGSKPIRATVDLDKVVSGFAMLPVRAVR